MTNNKQSGFGVIVIIVAIVALVILGYAGYRIYTAQTSKPVSTTNTTTNQTNGNNTNQNANTQAVDPYAGWKTYCDTIEKSCFKYPGNWTLNSNSVGVTSPTGSVVINYIGNDQGYDAQVQFYTVSLDSLTATNTNLKVVGGFESATSNVTPYYKLVDHSQTTNLVVGRQTSFAKKADFSFPDHSLGSLQAFPINTNFDITQAKTWFSSDDAKTALLIEKSFYLE